MSNQRQQGQSQDQQSNPSKQPQHNQQSDKLRQLEPQNPNHQKDHHTQSNQQRFYSILIFAILFKKMWRSKCAIFSCLKYKNKVLKKV